MVKKWNLIHPFKLHADHLEQGGQSFPTFLPVALSWSVVIIRLLNIGTCVSNV